MPCILLPFTLNQLISLAAAYCTRMTHQHPRSAADLYRSYLAVWPTLLLIQSVTGCDSNPFPNSRRPRLVTRKVASALQPFFCHEFTIKAVSVFIIWQVRVSSLYTNFTLFFLCFELLENIDVISMCVNNLKHHCRVCATWWKCDAAGPCGLPCMEAGGGACAAVRSHWLAVTSLISSLSLLLSNSWVLSRFMEYLTAILFSAFTVFSCSGSLKTGVQS